MLRPSNRNTESQIHHQQSKELITKLQKMTLPFRGFGSHRARIRMGKQRIPNLVSAIITHTNQGHGALFYCPRGILRIFLNTSARWLSFKAKDIFSKCVRADEAGGSMWTTTGRGAPRTGSQFATHVGNRPTSGTSILRVHSTFQRAFDPNNYQIFNSHSNLVP